MCSEMCSEAAVEAFLLPYEFETAPIMSSAAARCSAVELSEVPPVSGFTRALAAENEQCDTCQQEIQDDETLLQFPCRNEFHKRCSRVWLRLHNRCPAYTLAVRLTVE